METLLIHNRSNLRRVYTYFRDEMVSGKGWIVNLSNGGRDSSKSRTKLPLMLKPLTNSLIVAIVNGSGHQSGVDDYTIDPGWSAPFLSFSVSPSFEGEYRIEVDDFIGVSWLTGIVVGPAVYGRQ